MALMILIDFLDEEAALDLAEKYEGKGLVGVYKRPTQFCICGGQAFTHGQKYGWWVCSNCRRPKKLAWENLFSGEKMFSSPNPAFNLLHDYFEVEGPNTVLEISRVEPDVSTLAEGQSSIL